MPDRQGSACQSDELEGHSMRAAREITVNSVYSQRFQNTHGRRAIESTTINVTRNRKDLNTGVAFASPGNHEIVNRAGSRNIAG